MFKLSGRKREAKGTENKKRGESQGGVGWFKTGEIRNSWLRL